MEILTIAIIMCLLLSLYNFWMGLKITKAFIWILSHVHVVGKSNQKEPDFEQIKRAFGLKGDDQDPGK